MWHSQRGKRNSWRSKHNMAHYRLDLNDGYTLWGKYNVWSAVRYMEIKRLQWINCHYYLLSHAVFDRWWTFIVSCIWMLVHYMKGWLTNWDIISFLKWECRFIGNGSVQSVGNSGLKVLNTYLCYCVFYILRCVCYMTPFQMDNVRLCFIYIQLLN